MTEAEQFLAEMEAKATPGMQDITIISFMDINSFECEVCGKELPMDQMSGDFGLYNELFMCVSCAKVAARESLEDVLATLRAENIELRARILSEQCAAANSPDVVTADIDEILRLRAEMERVEKEADWLATAAANNGWHGERVSPEWMRETARKAVEETPCPKN